MADILTPALGESVTEATIAKWTKKVGDPVKKDELLVELETDKVSLEVVSPADGVLGDIKAAEGDTVTPGAVLGSVSEGGAAAPAKSAPAKDAPAKEAKPAAASEAVDINVPTMGESVAEGSMGKWLKKSGEAVKKDELLVEIETDKVAVEVSAPADGVLTIARRLKESQNTAAQLTTFNEVDMTNVMALRSQYKEAFEKRHGVKLGFMSFFTKAVIAALHEIPAVNAEIDGTDIIYKNHYDIGIAVGTEKGLVVPVLRDADTLNLAGIEKGIAALGKAARDGSLSLDQLQGGTFTITNGGTYGSLMSTPILNAPQSGILGMHNIVQRPMAINGEVKIRPMMYLALSYDHRIVDGKEAVTFLVRVKELLEDPQRALLGL
ncbi:dihydrolipoyllysine-residue succinyltransferase [Brevundimonas sp.]|uniref:dihydrolipoyllysine-residue succinyltransferase n=1 Tax=Brevundimonas sp. TaxID=1871086 RepID=UPI0019C3DBEA|nr:dihydrolipoyllysine-residue succinyltransferase [Brevundimonas sp.]MBD3836192.1 dihydrolipoyllysine-residue succinyltransferase [Brevundimonas sp.]